jgi:hypothetical protein
MNVARLRTELPPKEAQLPLPLRMNQLLNNQYDQVGICTEV